MSEATSQQTATTACPLDCPDACSLEVTTRDGRLERVEGSQSNPLTDGFICSKVRRIERHVYGDERLLHPARRVGTKGEGRFERISWDEALTALAEQLRNTRDRFGGEAILPLAYGGSNGYLTQDSTDALLFRRLGASRLARTVCAAPSGRAAAGLYGKFPGIALEDYEHAQLIVVWGANPDASGIHHVPIVRKAQAAGARLVVVDPRVTPLARQADLHLALRPGTDLVVALALVRWLFDNNHADLSFLEEHTTGWQTLREKAQPWTLERAAATAGLTVEDLGTFARLYATTRPAALRCGWGPERNRNGGSATAAILALPAVAGHFGVRGGGYTMSNSSAWKLDAGHGEPEASTRTINMNRVGRALESGEPPVRLLFVYNCNPLATLPEQVRVRRGLERADLFTVVFEQVLTDTARYADLILPATTFLEHHDLRAGYGSMALQHVQPVIEPVGEARANLPVFADLLHRLDLTHPGDPSGTEGWTQAFLNGLDPAAVQALTEGRPAFHADGGRPVQFVDEFPRTPDHKVHLFPQALDDEAPEGLYTFQPDPGSETFPLALLSPALRATVSSTFGQLLKGPAELELDPVDAELRGIHTGDTVRVWNELGEVVVQARVSRHLRPGVANLPKGLWTHHTANGNTSNALAPDTLSDLGGGACFNDARVQVERLS